MPTKAELTQEIYLLLGVIHLHSFVMSPDMGQKIFDHWRRSSIATFVHLIMLTLLAAVMGPRPESAEAIINDYNAILQQVTTR